MQYKVDASVVADGAVRARTSSAAIRQEVAGMLTLLTSLEGTWQGGAATAFSAVLQQWRATQTQVESSLDSISAALDASARNYSDAESAALRMFA